MIHVLVLDTEPDESGILCGLDALEPGDEWVLPEKGVLATCPLCVSESFEYRVHYLMRENLRKEPWFVRLSAWVARHIFRMPPVHPPPRRRKR